MPACTLMYINAMILYFQQGWQAWAFAKQVLKKIFSRPTIKKAIARLNGLDGISRFIIVVSVHFLI